LQHAILKRLRSIIGLSLIFLLSLSGCQEKPLDLAIPDGFPEPEFPENNVPNRLRVQLGEKLFFDRNLSLDSTVSCSSCHLPERAFTDGLPLSPGIQGRLGKRNTPSILNAAYLGLINKDGGVKNLDLQALVPIEDENEMGIPILHLATRLSKDPEYVKQAQAAYGQPPNPFVITRALASFVRTLYSGDSPYDRYVRGDSSALSPAALQGKSLFESERLNCAACHSGFNFTNNAFENNGLYTEYRDIGRALITLNPADSGKFRVPMLRNVAVTAPYMHDGSLATLEDVINHYEKAGQQPTALQSDKIRAFTLSVHEKKALIDYLNSLTDVRYGDESIRNKGEDQR
jgi:cytochrome c peroxidase